MNEYMNVLIYSLIYSRRVTSKREDTRSISNVPLFESSISGRTDHETAMHPTLCYVRCVANESACEFVR